MEEQKHPFDVFPFCHSRFPLTKYAAVEVRTFSKRLRRDRKGINADRTLFETLLAHGGDTSNLKVLLIIENRAKEPTKSAWLLFRRRMFDPLRILSLKHFFLRKERVTSENYTREIFFFLSIRIAHFKAFVLSVNFQACLRSVDNPPMQE